jgi:hypothetical protein
MDVRIPPITLRNANMYWTIIILDLVSGVTFSLPLGLSTAKPPTPVILAIMILGYER